MTNFAANLSLLVLTLCLWSTGFAQDISPDNIIPVSFETWQAVGHTATYDRKTVFDYLDGGAEIYLAYGMKCVHARRYSCHGEQAIELSIFEMAQPGGAFGAFTYERLGGESMIPDLLKALPQEGLRPLTVRYALSPLILKNLERPFRLPTVRQRRCLPTARLY